MARKKVVVEQEQEEEVKATTNNHYDRKQLISILQKVKPALSSKNVVEEFSSFIFTGENLITNNDRICICYPLKTDFKCSVPANEFYGILSSIKEDGISIEQKENKLVFIAKNTSAELITKELSDTVNEFIQAIGLNDFSKDKFKPLPKDFIEAVTACMFTASKDDPQAFLTCINVDNKEVISSDFYRISMFVLDESMKDKFLIPATSIQELIKLEVSGYFRSDNWIYFLCNDEIVFCSRILSDEFPDVKQEFEFESEVITLPDDFINMVNNASVLAEGDFEIDKKIEVKIKDGKISCKGQNELGWIESKIDIQGRKEDISFSINPVFLLQILSKTKNMKVGEGRVMFEADNFKHLISLYND